MSQDQGEPPTLRDLFRQRDFMAFWVSRWLGTLGVQVQSVAMGWHIYAVSRRTLSVGASAFNVSLIGLVTFVPLLVLALPAGETADRHDRRRIVLICYAAETAIVVAMFAASAYGAATIPVLLALACAFGVPRAYFSPANSALAPMLVPPAMLPRAIAFNSLAWQSASIMGPALGGLLVVISPTFAYGATTVLYAGAVIALLTVKGPTRPTVQPGSPWDLMKEGLVYVWTNKVVLGAISLDLAAVLLGGATALLPAFARDVLQLGPDGFGLLRAAPAAGATVVGLYIARRPVRRRSGHILFASVGLFGFATVVFGVSHRLWLSLIALGVLGGADMLSVFVRQTLVQVVTPDAMRGRVGAVSGVFISASNELGEFESGLAARFLGAVGAAVLGGVGAMIVTGAWAAWFPALRKADRLE